VHLIWRAAEATWFQKVVQLLVAKAVFRHVVPEEEAVARLASSPIPKQCAATITARDVDVISSVVMEELCKLLGLAVIRLLVRQLATLFGQGDELLQVDLWLLLTGLLLLL
jgi:hypothetical protein